MKTALAIIIGAISAMLLRSLLPTLGHLAAGTRIAGPLAMVALILSGFYGAIGLMTGWRLARLCCLAFLATTAGAQFATGPSIEDTPAMGIVIASGALICIGVLLFDWVRDAAAARRAAHGAAVE